MSSTRFLKTSKLSQSVCQIRSPRLNRRNAAVVRKSTRCNLVMPTRRYLSIYEHLLDCSGCEITFISARFEDYKHKETCHQVRQSSLKLAIEHSFTSTSIHQNDTLTDGLWKLLEHTLLPKGTSRFIVGTQNRSRSHIYQHIPWILMNVVPWFSTPCWRLKTNRYQQLYFHRHSST